MRLLASPITCCSNWLKRRLYLWVMGTISLGVPVIGGFLGKFDAKTFTLFLFGGVIIYVIHTRPIGFCRSCGATNNNPMWPFQSFKFCRECGHPFGVRHVGEDDNH
jgi:hypothetical protein